LLHLVTGAAGLVGVNLVARLLARGDEVLAIDNFSLGRPEYLARFTADSGFRLAAADCADLDQFRNAVVTQASLGSIDEVWHLAANSNIPAGIADPRVDLRNTFLTTFNALLLMREFAIPTIRFASSSAIYGDHGDRAITEDAGPCRPISNYGAMKLAAEAQISAAGNFLGRADIFRFPNVVGTPATHGVIPDFVAKLRHTPDNLEVLGNGKQQKVYLHVDDLVDAMLFIADHASERMNAYNIGPVDDGVTVKFIAEEVRAAVSPKARISYGTEERGWVGDIPKYRYSTQRLACLGWSAPHDSAQSVRRAVAAIVGQAKHG
jgi:UDP-glucose 4-epimerase